MTAKCRQCGEDLRESARFCVGCGRAVPAAEAPLPSEPKPMPDSPPSAKDRSSLPQNVKVGIAAGICAVVVGVAVVVSVTAGKNPLPTGGSGGPGSLTTTETSTPTPYAEPTTDVTTMAPVDARTSLQQEAELDRPKVAQLIGYWVPQLSAKKPGMVANGVTYDYDSIWADFVTNRQSHPEALLLWSGDYPSFKYPDFWITVVPEQFGDGDSANTWCDSYGIGKDDCYAKRIMRTGGYNGNTVLRK